MDKEAIKEKLIELYITHGDREFVLRGTDESGELDSAIDNKYIVYNRDKSTDSHGYYWFHLPPKAIRLITGDTQNG